MAETHETSADIIAEMETERPGLMNAPINTNNLYYARRLKAALKRERGDTAKLRETLENAAKELVNATEDENFGEDVMYLVGCMRTVSQKCRAALAPVTEKEGGNK